MNCLKAAKLHVVEALVPRVRVDFERALTEPFILDTEESASESKVFFRYPKALGDTAYGSAHAYINPAVLLELGARADHYPTRQVAITPYAAIEFPNEFTDPACLVIAQAPERTLLEKALILHSGIGRGRFSKHTSRHAYDLARLFRDKATMDAVTHLLFKQVAEHKVNFADDRLAGDAPTAGIRLVPPGGELRQMLADDYRSMNEMFFQEPPAFAVILEDLGSLEVILNALPR